MKRKRGLEVLFWLAAFLNDPAQKRRRFERAGDALGVTKGRVSQLVSGLFEVRFVLRPGAQAFADDLLRTERKIAQGQEEELKRYSDVPLVFIPGRLYDRPAEEDIV